MTPFTKKESEAPVEEINEERNTLGERLAVARKNKGLTQEEFAKQLDVTPQAVSKWENDLSCPDIMLLPKISDILGISIEVLLTGTKKTDKEAKIPVSDNSKLKLKIKITPQGKKATNITVPVALVKKIAKIGNGISGILGNPSISSSQLEEILQLAEEGVVGEILNIDAEDGTIITVEISK